ncbi:hypothetical protein EC957_005543 [Mortierella hygrophila]|uniref:Transmembrane protein n=1 Tax=Mortierella hygrophila TaxID=979708 RepID=A0A9P6F066_9FUNG|nr:hypothetical protein EC957_005543 [Mortierella hygrophila]
MIAMPFLTRNRVTLLLRGLILLHSLVDIVSAYIFFEIFVESAQLKGWINMASLNRVTMVFTCIYLLSGILRAVVSYSSRTVLAQLALYVWPVELILRVVYVGYRISIAAPDVFTFDSFQSIQPMVLDFVKFVVVGVGLKMVLDETKASDERALQSREESIQGLDKEDEYIGVGSSKERQGGNEGRTEEEEEEDNKPETLSNLMSKRSVILGFHFMVAIQNNWKRIKVADNYPWFIMTALVFNMCVEVFGLLVLVTAADASRRRFQMLYYAILSCLLIDVCLSVQGRTRFINEPIKSMLPMALIDYVGSLLWSWIYPSFDAVMLELIPIYIMWRMVRDFKRMNEEDAKKDTDAEREQQRIDGPKQEPKESP